MKRCTKCNRRRRYSQFNSDKSKKDGLYSSCKECRKKIRKDYYIKHREDLIEKASEWANENKERRKKIEAKYRSKNRRKEKLRTKRYREENPEKRRQTNRKYYLNHPEVAYKSVANRRARKMGATIGKIDYEEIKAIGICYLCNKKVNFKLKYPHPRSKSFDHVVPLSKGGSHSQENVKLTHLRCNKRKTSKILKER